MSHIGQELFTYIREYMLTSMQASIVLRLLSYIRLSLWDYIRASLGSSLEASLWASIGVSLGAPIGSYLEELLVKCFRGQHKSSWIGLYLFCNKIGVSYPSELLRQLQLWESLANSCHSWWPFENICIVSDRPTLLSVNTSRQLHSANGPAIAFADGLAMWAIDGVDMTQERQP